MVVFKTLKLLLNLFQIDGPINEMPFWPTLLYFKGISKAIFDLVLYVFFEGTKSSFTYNGEVPFQELKTFATFRCSILSFIGSQFIFLYSLAAICCLELSFKQKRIHLFLVPVICFSFSG